MTGGQKLFVVLFVAGMTAILVTIGWLTSQLGLIDNGFIGGLFGGAVGSFIAPLLARRFQLLDGDTWWAERFAPLGFFFGMGASTFATGNEFLIQLVGAVSSGLGIVLGNYLDHFFDYERPQSIF